MNRSIFGFIPLMIFSTILTGQDPGSSKGSYFSQPSPGLVPQIFAKGIISTDRFEHATPAFCGMNEFYFSRIAGNGAYFENTHYIMGSDNTWRIDTLQIENKYISTEYYRSRDGKRLYFSSLRPANIQTDPARKKWNIWYSDITANGWSEPRLLPAPVNSGFHECQFFEAIDGSFYFTSWRNNNQPDIFRAILKNGKYEIDTLFGININTAYDEKDPVLSEKGDYLLFKSNRPGGIGKNDIYISFLKPGNNWSDPVNIGSKINSQYDEWYPRASPDGNYLFFLSDRTGDMDVYWIDAGLIIDSVTEIKPSPRLQLAMVFDIRKNKTVLFGGSNNDGEYLGDMWELDVTGWNKTGQFDDMKRVVHAMAYDEARNVTVMSGGWKDGRRVSDTWEFNGKNWIRVSTKELPAFDAHQIVFYPPQNEIILFGGIDSNLVNNKYTYVYNGRNWRIVDSTGPAARYHHTMVYDETRKKIVLFGGNTVELSNKPGMQQIVQAQKGDTWEWDGRKWTEIKVKGPCARDHQAMAYDSDRKVVVLFGGFNGEYLADTWEYDGKKWTHISDEGPPARGGKPGMVYDKSRKKVIMFGGGIGGGTSLEPRAMDDTWEWDGKSWVRIL